MIKTRSGGQAVQFTDIETLKQELAAAPRYEPAADEPDVCDGTVTFSFSLSRFSRKRKSSENKGGGDQKDGAWTDVETRVGRRLIQSSRKRTGAASFALQRQHFLL